MPKQWQGNVSFGRPQKGAVKCVTRAGEMGATAKEGFSEEVVFGLNPAHHSTFFLKALV